MGFPSHPSCRSSIALSLEDSYREHADAIAAIQLITKAWLNSHMDFASNCVTVAFFVWDLIFLFKAIIKITWERSTQGPQ